MADIGGIGGFNPVTTRSTFDAEAAAQRRAEERARQEELQEARRSEAVEEDARAAEESDTDQDANAQAQQQQEAQDEVTLSNAAQDFLSRAQDDAATQAANDDAQIQQAQAAQEAGRVNQVGGVNGTNQTTADEENNATVNGNQDDQSEQTRALGQIVDQFA